jgi:Family of unknown function (DUF6599)
MKIKGLIKAIASAFLMMPFFLFLQGESNIMPSERIPLPDAIDGWMLEGQPQLIDATNIFNYMNGAGELYLGYHFDHLSVYEYKDKTKNSIVVELYQMMDSRDAFGLLSMDWSGEAVELNPPGPGTSVASIVPPCRALYGKGLLRAWSDDLYIRIMASREIPGAREVILQLGSLITTGRDNPAPPDFLQLINPSPGGPWTIKKDRTAYFYSHLVLNSFFYLSHENILNLDSGTEALLLTFNRELLSLDRKKTDSDKSTAHLLVIRYPDFQESSKALHDFFGAYLPELTLDKISLEGQESHAFIKIEDGWLGYKLLNRHLALALACPDQPSAFRILDQIELK